MKRGIFPLLCTIMLAACGGPYTVTLNQAVVYTPNRSATGVLEDANFQGCLNQVLSNTEERDLARVTTLACPSAGISSLNGIEALENLEQLDLSGNSVSDLSPLSSLRNLRVLSLRDNEVRSVSNLQSLPLLRFISLEGNEAIPCRQLDSLQEKAGTLLTRPQSCAG